MAQKKIKLTRTELKIQRDALSRFQRYLPTLKLKQQQIQTSIVAARQAYQKVNSQADAVQRKIAAYERVFQDTAGINVQSLATPEKVVTSIKSIAGIKVPSFKGVHFTQADYSLFVTAPWVDRTLQDLCEFNRLKAELDIIKQGLDLLASELKKVMQRVNLFEKIKIPATQENIRRIRIAVGDQMTAAVARAKIAKGKLEQKERQRVQEAVAV
jgi:V/A-type H+-transporting ATPase subunit D